MAAAASTRSLRVNATESDPQNTDLEHIFIVKKRFLNR